MRCARIIPTMLASLVCTAASAQVSFDLITDDLEAVPIRLMSITQDAVVWDDGSGDLAMLPIDDALGLASRGALGGASEPAGAFGVLSYQPSMLQLTDGRALTGSLSADAALPETLRWQHPVLGKVDVPLEQIDRLVLPRATLGGGSAELLPPADRNDVVLLRNGDRLEGFVVELGRDAVIEVDSGEIAVPMEAVYQVALANPAEAWDGPMVWLRDGSALGVTDVRFSENTFVVIEGSPVPTEAEDGIGGARSITIRPEHVEAVSFEVRRLVPVSRLLGTDEAGLDGRTFGATAIELAGESSVGIELPPGARRLSLTVELPLRARAWGRCELVVAVDGVARERLSLSAATPVADTVLDLTGAQELELILEPGEFGRVQSRVEIRDALIAVD